MVRIVLIGNKDTHPIPKSIERVCTAEHIPYAFFAVHSLADIQRLSLKPGDVVYPFAMFHHTIAVSLIDHLLSIPDITLVNRERYQQQMADKFIQSEIIKSAAPETYIPTYIGSSPDDIYTICIDTIGLPCIAKEINSFGGKGVYLIEHEEDIKHVLPMRRSLIFQPFIKNEGDYRVVCIGDRVIFHILRKAQSGKFLNNLASGGTATFDIEERVKKEISEIALNIHTATQLDFSGLDITKDLNTGTYKVFEINSLQPVFSTAEKHGIPVSKIFVQYLVTIYG